MADDWDEDDSLYDRKIKVLMIGDSGTSSMSLIINKYVLTFSTVAGVGKTCLVLRYTKDQFSSSFITTIGIDYKTKKLVYKNQNIAMQVWDTAGQERFRSITGSYIRGAHGIVLVYDITDAKSFDSIHGWLTTIVEVSYLSTSLPLSTSQCFTTTTTTTTERRERIGR